MLGVKCNLRLYGLVAGSMWELPPIASFHVESSSICDVEMKAKFVERIVEMIDMEKITDYTCDPDFITSYNKLMIYHAQFSNLLTSYMSNSINVEDYGSINIGHLREVPENTRNQAFDLKMMMTAYWKIVLKRMVDCLALQLLFFIQKVVNKEMGMEIVSKVMGHGIEKMLNEPLSMAKKQEPSKQHCLAPKIKENNGTSHGWCCGFI